MLRTPRCWMWTARCDTAMKRLPSRYSVRVAAVFAVFSTAICSRGGRYCGIFFRSLPCLRLAVAFSGVFSVRFFFHPFFLGVRGAWAMSCFSSWFSLMSNAERPSCSLFPMPFERAESLFCRLFWKPMVFAFSFIGWINEIPILVSDVIRNRL